jgi:hypothetical protein
MPLCECELATWSEHPSPGVVGDDELVLRVIYVPEHVDDNGRLLPEAIPTQDLQRRLDETGRIRTLSVFRERYVDDHSLIELAERQIGSVPASRQFAVVCSAQTANLRALQDEVGHRVVCVVDDALADEPSHAGLISAKELTRSKAKGVRLRLIKMLDPEVSFSIIPAGNR